MTILILILSVIVLAIVILIMLAKYEAFEAVPLLKAIKRNRTEEALALLRQGVDVNLTNKLEETPLICAAFAGNLEVAKVLVEAGAGVNAQSIPTRFSSLMWAALKGYTEIVRLLIEAGADVNVRDWDQNTPLIKAALSGHQQAVEELLAAGADINAWNKDRDTALTSAILMKHTGVAHTMIKAGAEVNSINKRGESALVLLLHTQQYETAAAFFDDLMLAGVDIHATNAEGSSALTAAVTAALREQAKGSHPLLNVIRRLVKAGADVNLALAIANGAYAPEFFDKHKREIINILSGG